MYILYCCLNLLRIYWYVGTNQSPATYLHVDILFAFIPKTEGDATTVESSERPFDRDLWDGSSAVVNLSKDDVSKLLAGDREKATLIVLYAPWCPFC